MKLQVSAAAIAALSSGTLFSISDNVLLAYATESPLSPRAAYAADVHEYEEHLKKKLRAKIALRRKSRGADKSSKDEFCTPSTLRLSTQFDDDGTADLGVLSSKCVSQMQTCVPDPGSSLGGRCLNAATVQQERDSFKSTNSTLFMSHVAGAECIPQDSAGLNHVDLGILNECTNPEYVCVEDASSQVGGICVDSSSLSDNSVTIENVRSHRRLLQCDYKNGTSGGVKCTGNKACDGLSAAFISSQIGCGSCNGEYGEFGI